MKVSHYLLSVFMSWRKSYCHLFTFNLSNHPNNWMLRTVHTRLNIISTELLLSNKVSPTTVI